GLFNTQNNPTAFSNPINFNGSAVFTNTTAIFTGPITLADNATLNPLNNQIYLDGSIGESGGSRSLTVTGGNAGNGNAGGTLYLNNANTYTGGTILAMGNGSVTTTVSATYGYLQ